MLRIGAQWAERRANRVAAVTIARLEWAFKPLPSGILKSGLLPKYIFSRWPERVSGTGLVQQTVQIVASHDLTLFVSHSIKGVVVEWHLLKLFWVTMFSHILACYGAGLSQ